MSTKAKVVSTDLEGISETAKPRKNVKEEKEKAKIFEASFINEDEEEEIDIRPDKYITVINLCSGELNLSTLPGGRGKTFTFRSFGEKKRILYSNLVDIMDALPGFLERGSYYIADKKVTRKHGLEDLYAKLLSKENIERIFNESMLEEDITTLYKSANISQQEVIIDLLVRKLVAEEDLDMNMVNSISRISKVDILKKVEEAKFYSQPIA